MLPRLRLDVVRRASDPVYLTAFTNQVDRPKGDDDRATIVTLALAGVYCGSATRGGNAFERTDLQAALRLTYRTADAVDRD